MVQFIFQVQLRVITTDGIKLLKDLRIGDLVKCDTGDFLPVKSVLFTRKRCDFIRFSNGVGFYINNRTKLKSTNGFKYPEVYDDILISEDLIPCVTDIKRTKTPRLLCDILIDGNMVTPEGFVFRFGEQDGKTK